MSDLGQETDPVDITEGNQLQVSIDPEAKEEDDRPTTAELPATDQLALQGQDDNGDTSRPATSGRIPSNMAQARFSRSTFHGDQDFSSDDEDDDDNVSDGVLITEVKEVNAINDLASFNKFEADNDSSRRSGTMLSACTNIYIEDDEDGYWDTDLEMDEEREEHDPTGRTQYAKACERLGVVPVSYFSRHLTDNEITMRYHGLGPLGTKAIAKILRTNIIVEKLNLCGNWMEGEGAMYMARMLLENDYITYMTLSENQLGAVGAHHISKMLLVNAGLRTLDLSANDIGDDSAGCIAEALEQNKYLKEMMLSRNKFGEEGGEILGPAIGANDVLDHLDLSWNLIRHQGAIAVARGVKENIRLKSCDLSWNGLGPVGGAAVADAIATNETLQELDVSGNRFDVNIAELLAKSLKKNEELKIFRMGCNPITTAGCIALAKALNDSDISVLEVLDLKEIPVEYEFLKLVEEIKKKRPFEVIHGTVLRSGNTVSDIGKRAVDLTKKKDPLLVLREHIVINDTRIFDLLKRFDEKETYSVAPEQFASALEELGVPFNKEQLDDISKKLDKNSDGQIYYGDMLNQLEAAGGKPFLRPVSAGMEDSHQTAAQDNNTAVKLQYTRKDS